MSYTVKIIFGKEQVNKFYSDEPLTEYEKENNVKVYHFNSESEKQAFCKGINEAVGWVECCFADLEFA